MKINCKAYILAGGKSSRMGQDKATIILFGKPFIQHIHETLISLGISCSIISSNKKHESLGIPLIKDSVKDIGPLGGLSTVLENTSSEWSFIVSCDIPLTTKNSIDWLIQQNREGFDAIIPIVDGRKNPLFGLYHSNCKLNLEKQLSIRNFKMTHFLDTVNTKYIIAPSAIAKELININTPNDLKAIVK